MAETAREVSGFGSYLKDLRKQNRVTLREFCRRAEADPGNVSRLERGIVPPPQRRDILERYAAALGIEEGSDEWYSFFDTAAASRGRVPADLMEDRSVVDMLPVFYRTLRGQKPTADDMRRLAEKLRDS